MSLLRLLDHVVVALVRLGGAMAALLMLFCAFAIFAGIVGRSFGIPMAWPTEIVPHLLLVAVMFASGETFRRGEHIAVDILVNGLGPRARRIIDVWASATVVYLAFLLIEQGLDMIAFSRMTGIRTFDRLDFPIWWVQSVIPIGGVLLGLAALRSLLGAIFGKTQAELSA